MSTRTRKVLTVAAIMTLAIWATWISVLSLSYPSMDRQSFSGIGGGPIAPNAGGFFGVALDTDTANLTSGKGTTTTPLLTKLTVGSGLGGTGSAGGNIHTSLLVGSGLAGNGSNTNLTTSLLVGSGLGGNGSNTNLTTSLMVGSGLAGNGSNTNLTTSLSVGSGLSGNGSSSTLTTSLNVGSGLGGTGSSSPLTTSLSVGSGLNGTGSSSPLTVNVTAATCTNGQGVNAIDATGNGTCGNVGRNAYGGTHFEWTDDQIGGVANARTVEGFTTSLTSGTVSTNGTTTRPGIIDYNVAAATPTRAGEITSPQLIDFGSGNWTYDWVGGFPTLSTSSDEYVAEMGFIDVTTGINPADGCWFLYDRGNSAASGPNSGNTAALSCYCASNSVVTTYLINGSGNSDESFALGTLTVAALTLPDTNIIHLRIVMTGTTRAEFYAVKGAGSLAKVCDINTHIPSGSSRVTGAGFLMSKTVGSTLRAMSVDFVGIAVDLTAARTN